MYKSILVAIDGSELSIEAAKVGLGLAKTLGASVTLATVTDRWPLVEAAVQAQTGIKNPEEHFRELAKREAQSAFDLAARYEQEQGQERGLDCRHLHIMDKHPADGILDAAAQAQAELIVLASHGRRGLQRMLLGSVANEVTTRAQVPVLIVK